MSGVNKVILIGNLGRDPELKHLDSGVSFAKFSLATTEYYKDRDGNRTDRTEWHNIVVWRNLADIAEKYLKKGSKIYVEGKIRTRSYDDKDGNKKYITEIVADYFTMLDSRSDRQQSNQSSENISADTVEETGDDLPF